MHLRTELARVEQLFAHLSREVLAAEKAVKREIKDVKSAKYPLRASIWADEHPDPDEIAREVHELGHAEAELSIATELVRIVRARLDTLVARDGAGATSSDDTASLAHDLRERLAAVDSAAADAQGNAIRAALQGGDVVDPSFVRARRELARARVQLALLIAGTDGPMNERLSAIDLNVTARAPDARWREQVTQRCAQLIEALGPLLPTSAYR
jgi:hypothetical protein